MLNIHISQHGARKTVKKMSKLVPSLYEQDSSKLASIEESK